MGCAIGSVVPVTSARGEAADGVDCGGLLRLLFAQRWQDAGQAAGQHALAGAGHPQPKMSFFAPQTLHHWLTSHLHLLALLT